MDKVEIWGKMIGAILKYNSTRISMRDRLNILLEEENNLLRKKVDLLFGNLKEYEDIIEDEWLAGLADSAKIPELTVDILSQLFADKVTVLANPLGDFENTFARDGVTVKRQESDALWIKKRQEAGTLLNEKCNDDQKELILSMALRDGETPEEFMKIVVSEFNRIPRLNGSKPFVKRANPSSRPYEAEETKVKSPVNEQQIFEATLQAFSEFGLVEEGNA